MTDYAPTPSNKQVITYDRWLSYQWRNFHNPRVFIKHLITDSSPNEYKDFKQRFMLEYAEHPQRGWIKPNDLARMKADTLLMRCKFLHMIDSGISQNQAVERLADEYNRHKSTIRERLKRKK